MLLLLKKKLLEELSEARFPITDLKQGVKVNGIQQTDDAVLHKRAVEIVNDSFEQAERWSGVYDMNGERLNVNDDVTLFGMKGEVCFACGAFGIGIMDIDWDLIESKIEEVTGCKNHPAFCHNDNFISFWELMWNFNCEDSTCSVVELYKPAD